MPTSTDHRRATAERNAVAILDAAERLLTRAEVECADCPFDGVEAGGFASAVAEDFPFVRRHPFRVDADHDALAAETFGALADELGGGERAGVDADLVGPGVEHGVHVLSGADAAADGERHETLRGGALDDVDHRGAAMRAGGDVEENHLVRALVIVTQGQLHGIADIAQPALLGAAELDAAGDFSVMNVETGNDTFCQHIGMEVISFGQKAIRPCPEFVTCGGKRKNLID